MSYYLLTKHVINKERHDRYNLGTTQISSVPQIVAWLGNLISDILRPWLYIAGWIAADCFRTWFRVAMGEVSSDVGVCGAAGRRCAPRALCQLQAPLHRHDTNISLQTYKPKAYGAKFIFTCDRRTDKIVVVSYECLEHSLEFLMWSISKSKKQGIRMELFQVVGESIFGGRYFALRSPWAWQCEVMAVGRLLKTPWCAISHNHQS